MCTSTTAAAFPILGSMFVFNQNFTSSWEHIVFVHRNVNPWLTSPPSLAQYSVWCLFPFRLLTTGVS